MMDIGNARSYNPKNEDTVPSTRPLYICPFCKCLAGEDWSLAEIKAGRRRNANLSIEYHCREARGL